MKFLASRFLACLAAILVLSGSPALAQSLNPNALKNTLKPDVALLQKHNTQLSHRLSFIQNKGQWQGNAEHGQPRFLAKLGSANVWVTDDGLVYDFYKSNPNAHKHLPPHLAALQKPEASILGGHVVQMKFAGAKSNTKVYGVKQQPGYHNYFLGNDSAKWATDVPLYDEVVIGEIYDGIAAKIYFEVASVRYDMIVQPGADPSQITLAFDGAEEIFTNANGDLVMKTSLGDVVQGKLFAYQVINGKKQQIPCAFALKTQNSKLNTESISFALGSYNPALPLVIDPVLWSTFLGGNGADYVYRIAADGSGNTYACGSTVNNTFPTLVGSYQTAYQGGARDGFITKLNATGTARVYSTFIGGSLDDVFRSIKVDALGNAYVTGDSYGGGYPTTIGSPAGGVDWVITKLNAAGNALVYSRYFGGGATEAAYDIAVDGSGNAYVTGHTYSNDFSISGGCYQNVRNGLTDGVVCKLDGTGAMVYSTYIGGSNDDYPVYCEVDGSGNIYLMGYAASGYPTTGGAYQTAHAGGAGTDIVVTKMNTTGTGLVYSTYIGGTTQDLAFGIKLDASNNVLLCGSSEGNFPTTVGPAYAGGTSDGILCKLNAAGTGLLFARYIGGSMLDELLQLDFDGGTGDIYVIGTTDSPNYPTTVSCYQSAIAGGNDMVVTKLNNTATTLQYSSYFGGASNDNGYGIIFSATNTVYLGASTGSSLPTTAGAFQTTYGGGTADGFVTKFSTVPEPPTVTMFAPTSAYPMQVVTITGTNLTGASQVQFGVVNAAWYTVDSPTQIRAVVPFGAVTGAIGVTTPAGTAASGSPLTVTAAPQVSTLAGNGVPAGLDAVGQAAQYNSPRGVTVDASGNVYAADYTESRITKISPSGVVTTIAGGGGSGFVDGTGTAAKFLLPRSLAVDAAGNIYVADTHNHSIRKITPGGVVTTIAGTGSSGFADGAAASSQFTTPTGVAVNAAGTIVYVADAGNNRIRSISGGIVTTIAGSGVAGFADGAAASAQFNGPTCLAVNGSGTLFITDGGNNRIRVITAGVVSTLAGSGVAGYAEGLGTVAQFGTGLESITLDGIGNIYVADQGNNRIRKITSGGMVSTLAGTGGTPFTEGPVATASIGFLTGVAIDPTGNFFVSLPQRVVKIEIYTYQYVSGDAGIASNWRLLPGLVTPAPDFTTPGTQFQVASGVTATATSAFTLGAGVIMNILDNATLALNNVTMTNNGILSIADGATGGRLALTGTGAVTGNVVGYDGGNATLEAAGGSAKILNTSELPNPMQGKVIVNNTVGATIPATANIGLTGTINVNSGGRMIIPNSAVLLNNNPSGTSFTVQNGGTLEIQDAGQVAAGSASVVNYIAGSTLLYSGAVAKTTNAQEFPAAMSGNVTITNTQPVTLDASKTLGASAMLTLTSGRIVTSGANMLTVTNTAAGAVMATAGYVDGPLQRDMPASLAAPAVTYLFPLGVGATPYPFSISNPTTGATGPRLQMQAFASNAGGTAGTGISLLSTTEYWQMQQISGIYTSGVIFLQKAGLTATNTIGGNPIVPTGTYNGFTSTFGTGLTTVAPVTGTGCFLVGTGPIIYDWAGAPGADWQVAANWSPTRATPAATDILRFNAGTHTPTNLPNQTIQQLIIGGDVTLPPVSITLTVGVGGVQVATMRSLDLGTNITLTQNLGGTITVDGTLNTNASKVNGAGDFLLNASGTFATANNDGFNGFDAITGAMQMTGTVTYNPIASYAFTGTNGANRIMRFAAVGPNKPAIMQCSNLTIAASAFARTMDNNFTATGAVAVNGILQTAAQTLALGATGTLAIPSGGRLRVQSGGGIVNSNPSGASFTVQSGGYLEIQDNGQVSAASASDVNYVAGSTLEYSGTTTAKTTTAREIGASGVQNLLVTNTQSVTLGANALILQSMNINAASQLVLSNTGNPTLTLNGTLNQNGAANISSVNGVNAGSISLGGAGGMTLQLNAVNNTLNNFTISRNGAHMITGDLNVRGTLDLASGVLLPTTRILSGDPTGTAVGIITGGNANSYIQGSLQRRFAGGIATAGTNYAFPVGAVAGYRPATLVDVLTGASPIVEIENFDVGAMVHDISLTSLLSPRNWRVQTISGVFSGSAVTLQDAGVTSAYVVGRSVSQTGVYQSVGGTNSGMTVTSGAGAVPPAVNHHFAIGSVLTVITNVAPLTVSPGDTITITGNQFGGVSAVGIGGIPAASFQIISQTQIRAVVGAGGSGVVSLISPSGVAASTQQIAFMNAPVITGFSPTFATTGNTVRITGTRLQNPVAVSFGGLNALAFRSIDANTIDADVNLGNSGLVTVQTAGGLGASTQQFTFIYKPSIVNFFPKWARAGDTVNIFGGNFQQVSGVKFGNSAYKTMFTIVTSGQIRITVPPDASTGMIKVQNPVGIDSSWTNFTFVAPPTLTFAQPSPYVGIGQILTLTGTELHPIPQVRIGAVTAASVQWTSLNSIAAIFPQATSGVVTVTASGGTMSLPSPVQVIPPPVIQSFAPRSPSPGDLVTVTGANFFPGVVNISIGGVPVSSLTVNSSTRLTFVVPPTNAGALTISSPAGSITTTGANLSVVPQPQITGASGITTATIGQTIILQGIGLRNIIAISLGVSAVEQFIEIDTLGQVLALTVPNIRGIDSIAANPQTTQATIAVLTRSGFATYTMFFRSNQLGGTNGNMSTNGNSTSGTAQIGMRITGVSPVSLPEGSEITFQGVNIATNATVFANGQQLMISSQSTTAIVAQILDGFVPRLLFSTSAALLVSTPTVQIASPFPVQVTARIIPVFTSFFPLSGSTLAVITLSGQNFADGADSTQVLVRGSVLGVSIGGVSVESFRFISPTTLQATVGRVKSGLVQVQTPSALLTSAMSFRLDTNAPTFPPAPPVLSKDSLALDRFFALTQGMSWTTNVNWNNTAAPIPARFGVKVRNGRVVELRLPSNGIRGAFPAGVLENLDSLEALDISGNAFTGVLPSGLVNNKNLQILRLAGNQFSGNLPSGLCALARLRELDLSNNQITDSLSSLCCLSGVAVLNLRGNKFTGALPACLQNLQNLVTFDISQNNVSGAIPDAISALTQLQTFAVRGNRLTGRFPQGLVQTAAKATRTQAAIGLDVLDLGENNLSGAIPAEIGVLQNLRTLLLDRNTFTGALPQTMLSMSRLRRLDVSNNQLFGSPTLNIVPRLDTLAAQNNRFTIADLEGFTGIRTFTYLPQAPFAQPILRAAVSGQVATTASVVTVTTQESLRLSVPRTEQFSRTQWRKNGVLIANIGSQPYFDFVIPAFALADTGVYDCVITNDRLGGVTLTTASMQVLGRVPQVPPDGMTLLEPAPGESEVSVQPRFRWTNAARAEQYRLEVASDSSFRSIIASTTFANTSPTVASVVVSRDNMPIFFRVVFPLAFDRVYAWRVRAENTAGVSAWAVGSFTTLPPDAQLTASSFNFGKLTRFDSARGSIRLQNLSSSPLTILGVQADNGQSSTGQPATTQFQIGQVLTAQPIVLAAGSETALPVSFAARTVGRFASGVRVEFRVGMSAVVQSRVITNRLSARVSGLKVIPPEFDTVIVGRKRLLSATLVNLDDKPMTLQSASLLQNLPQYALRFTDRDLILQPNDTLILPMSCLATAVGAVPQNTLLCVSYSVPLSQLRREDLDTVPVSFAPYGRLHLPSDVPVQIGLRALDSNVAPGSRVRLELYLVSSRNLDSVFKAARPTFRGSFRMNSQVLASDESLGAIRPLNSSIRPDGYKAYTISPLFWSGRTNTLALFQCVAVAGATDSTMLILDQAEWGEGSVLVDSLIAGKFRVKTSQAGGKRLISPKTTTVSITSLAPNPAKDMLEMTYSLSEVGFVEIALLNVKGELVQVLVQEVRSSGNHTLQSRVDRLPSGRLHGAIAGQWLGRNTTNSNRAVAEEIF